MTNEINGTIFPAKQAMAIFQQFQKKNTLIRSKFRGKIEMSKDFNININIFSKTQEAKLPTLKKHSLVVEQAKEAKQGLLMKDTSYSEIEDTDKKIIDKENVLKAYFYGKQLVPVAKINEEIL